MELRRLFLVFIIFSFNQTVVNANIPGEDSSVPALLGSGYNSVNHKVTGYCVELGSLKTQSGSITGSVAEYRLLEITSETELRESLNINASASLNFGFTGNASARMHYARSVNKNRFSRYLMVHTRVGNQLEIASSFKFKDSAQKLLKSGRSSDFHKHCGNEFVKGRRTGGEFFAVLEFDISEDREHEEFSAAVSASGLGWKASTNINSSLAKFGKFSLMQIRILRVGANGPIPDMNSLQAYALTFPALVEAAGASPVTLELVTQSYDGVEPIDLSINVPLFLNQRKILEELAKEREMALENLSSVLYYKNNSHLFKAKIDYGKLSAYETSLRQFLNETMNAAVECFEDVQKGCKLPTHSFPYFEFPSKIRCENVRIPICKKRNSEGKCIIFDYTETIKCQ